MRATSVIACLILTAPVVGQLEKAKESQRRAESLPVEDEEGRITLLIKAYRLTEESSASSAAKRAMISKLRAQIGKLDSRALSRIKEQGKAAIQMLKSAGEYQEAGWKRTARQVLDLAMELDPFVNPAEVAELQTKLQGKNAEMLALFEQGIYPFGGKVWQFNDDFIASPKLNLDTLKVSSYLQSSATVTGNCRITVEVMMGDKPGTLGITVGGSGRAESFHMIGLEFSDSKSTVSLHRYEDARFTQIEDEAFKLSSKERSGWVSVQITISDNSLSAVVAGKQSTSMETARTIEGTIGFLISAFTRNPDPVRFRHLTIDRLP